jgi:uncharacterized protein
LQHSLKYRVLPDRLAVCQFPQGTHVPARAVESGFFCFVRTGDELSVVCAEDAIPAGGQAEAGWIALKLEGPFPFSMTGVLASFIQPLAEQGVPIFAISTFSTDYVLIKHGDLERAARALGDAGHEMLAPVES